MKQHRWVARCTSPLYGGRCTFRYVSDFYENAFDELVLHKKRENHDIALVREPVVSRREKGHK